MSYQSNLSRLRALIQLRRIDRNLFSRKARYTVDHDHSEGWQAIGIAIVGHVPQDHSNTPAAALPNIKTAAAGMYVLPIHGWRDQDFQLTARSAWTHVD